MNILFTIIPGLARALSGGSLFLQIQLLLKLWYFALSRKVFGFKSDFTIEGLSDGNPIIFHLRYVMDLAVLTEIYLEKEYDWCPVENPKVIVDLGAHFGDTALYYHSRFPDAKIIAVEPSPENYERLVKHTKDIPNIIPVQAAVGAEDGEITLNLMPSSLGHSVMERKESGTFVVVPQLTLATLFEQQQIKHADMIKFDIEGAEFSMFSDIQPEQFSSSYIGEIHLDLSEDSSLDKVLNSLSGFSLVRDQLANSDRSIIKAFRA